MLLCAQFASSAERNLLSNPGFEVGEGTAATDWTVGDDIYTVTTERAHSSQRSLKIVDPDQKAGSNVRSAAIAIEPGKDYAVWVWTYLEEGDPHGLGVYLDLLDESGKRLHDASERTACRVQMHKGEWSRGWFIVPLRLKLARCACGFTRSRWPW